MANDKNPIKLWFDNLKKIQGRMKSLNHLTKDNLKEFSKQQLGDLLLSDVMKGNLSQFCQNEHIGLVPNGAFADPKKTFFWFLNRISFSVEDSIRVLAYEVATEFKPELLEEPIAKVMGMSVSDVFGSEPLTSSLPKQELHRRLTDPIPGSFYPVDGSFLQDGTQKLSDMLNRIGVI